MRQQQAGGKGRLRVLAPHADYRTARPVGIVVDAADLGLLPLKQLQLLSDVLSFWDEADLFDKGDDVGARDLLVVRILLAPRHVP